jgi:hypothetical protein
VLNFKIVKPRNRTRKRAQQLTHPDLRGVSIDEAGLCHQAIVGGLDARLFGYGLDANPYKNPADWHLRYLWTWGWEEMERTFRFLERDRVARAAGDRAASGREPMAL